MSETDLSESSPEKVTVLPAAFCYALKTAQKERQLPLLLLFCEFCFPFPSPSFASAFLLSFSNLEELSKNPYFAAVVSLMLGKPYPRREPKASKNVSGLRAVAKVREVSVSPAAKSQMRVKVKQ